MLSLHLEGNNKLQDSTEVNCLQVQWSHRLYVENQEERNTKINLNIHSQQIVSRLFALSGLHEEEEEDEVRETLLDIDVAKLSYDTQSHKLIDIDPIKIEKLKAETLLSCTWHKSYYNIRVRQCKSCLCFAASLHRSTMLLLILLTKCHFPNFSLQPKMLFTSCFHGVAL